MRLRKHERTKKRRRGQFMTPESLVRRVLAETNLADCTRILEPSCGDGAFVAELATRLADQTSDRRVRLVGLEIDADLATRCRTRIQGLGSHESHVEVEVHTVDFFKAYLLGGASLHRSSFDLIVGNPPFGGSFDPSIEDELDVHLGHRLGRKIKKETYAFFIVACMDLLRPGGTLLFICSDTLMTIPTMTGLRKLLMEQGSVHIRHIEEFSDETTYPMIMLEFVKGERRGRVVRGDEEVDRASIAATPNLSWGITSRFAWCFSGALLGDRFVATSGMTTGKNELFVRPVEKGGELSEEYDFEFVDAPITVEYERTRARLGKLPPKRERMLAEAEARGQTERRVRARRRVAPRTVKLPDDRYRPYNKANGRLVYSDPTHYIYWENGGEAVLTFKKTGNWYLRGVGGMPHFGREGITWQLVASRFVARYLPAGYILDSGAPCAFVRNGVGRAEVFFVLGWLLSGLANEVLKTVVNHTRNIQSKDFERMPYPWWVSDDVRGQVVRMVEGMITAAKSGRSWAWADKELCQLSEMFEPVDGPSATTPANRPGGRCAEALRDDQVRPSPTCDLFSDPHSARQSMWHEGDRTAAARQ